MKSRITTFTRFFIILSLAVFTSILQAHEDESHAIGSTDIKAEVIAEAMSDEAGNPIMFPQSHGKIKIVILTLGKEA